MISYIGCEPVKRFKDAEPEDRAAFVPISGQRERPGVGTRPGRTSA